MNSYTSSCVVGKPQSHVFDFLSNIENLPKWATSFVKKIIKVDDKYKAITPIGEVFFRFDVDPKLGVIDMYTGAQEKNMTVAPLRVIGLEGNKSAITLTIFQHDGVDNRSWQLFCEYVKEEIENIKNIFS